MRAWVIAVGGLVFVVGVFLLQYLLRGLAVKPKNAKWQWDKFDTLTLITVVVVAFLGFLLAFFTSTPTRTTQPIKIVEHPQVVVAQPQPEAEDEPLLPRIPIARSELGLVGLGE